MRGPVWFKRTGGRTLQRAGHNSDEARLLLPARRQRRRAPRGFSISAARVQRARWIAGVRLLCGGLAPVPGARTLDHRGRSRVDAHALEPLETGLEGVKPRRNRARKLRVRGAGLMRRLERFEALGRSGGLGGMTKLLDLRA